MKKRSFLFLLLICLCAGNIFAQIQKPNLSGTWQLNLEKSKLDEFGKQSFEDGFFEKLQMQISQQRSNIIITDRVIPKKDTSEEELQIRYQFVTDGKIRLLKGLDGSISNPDDGFYKGFWFQNRLVIKLFSNDEKILKKTLMGTIEFSLSANKKDLMRVTRVFAENSFNGSRIGDSVMVYNLLEK
ncbi:MAG: hypothetical protein K1X72_06145 [Pyrinomonadaceae bacterium]|nr:hypothetical protein [Pyrinomonadaceae bacterium]